MTNNGEKYHFFWNGPFSQWQRCEFQLESVPFNTAEQAMMYFKALLFKDREIARKISKAIDPGKQKALGRQVRNFREGTWDKHKVDIVRRINLAKFGQNKGLRRKLFQTGDKTLVEASPHDMIWGIGLDEQKALVTPANQWPGQNLLGECLTDVRSQLRKEFPEELTLNND
jgi:ribA/ribD-fused uncharacterized protein